MNKMKFMTKKAYNKLMSKIMSMEDKLDYAIYELSGKIVQLGEVRTKLIQLPDSDMKTSGLEKVEKKIKELSKKSKELSAKKAEYLATYETLKAERDVLSMFSKVKIDGLEFTAYREIEKEIDQLKAEIDTLNFMDKL